MSARTCPECGGLVASTIHVCPHCGYHIDGSAYASTAHRGANPYNSIVWSIVALFIFWPCGLVSLIYYLKSDSSWCSGDAVGAQTTGATSIRWAKSTVCIIVISVVFLFLLMLLSLSV
jgi:hypothetical protein